MEIRWEVEDGYVCKSRQHTTEIDDNEIMECDTTEEANELIESCVQDSFDNDISWCIMNNDEVDNVVANLVAKST